MSTMSVQPFNRFVKLVARAFYDDVIPPKGDDQPKMARNDNRGIAVVVLDALTRRQWVREEDLARDLKMRPKLLRLSRPRIRTAKGAKIYSAAVAATSDGQLAKERDERIKLHTHSYCCLDHAQIYDVVRYKIHRLKKKQKEVGNKNTFPEYICQNCGRRYNALDALQLSSPEDEYFHCENCNGELLAETDKFAAQQANNVLQRLEVQLKPLMEQINRIKDLHFPEFGSLLSWEARACASGRAANGNSSSNDPSQLSQGLGYGGTPMPFLGDMKVEVSFCGVEGKEVDAKSETARGNLKVLPPWMIKQGMNLTEEQRGQIKQETETDGISAAGRSTDDKNSNIEEDKRKLQDEYVKAYYAALVKKQEELERAAQKQPEYLNEPKSDGLSGISNNRQVGIKSKREVNEEDDDIEWEEAPVTCVSLRSKAYYSTVTFFQKMVFLVRTQFPIFFMYNNINVVVRCNIIFNF